MPPELQKAYLETDFHVYADPAMVLRVGVQSSILAQTMKASGVTCAAFVSAANPRSEPVDGAVNALAHDRLLSELRKRRLTHIPGTGRHPSGSWPQEASVLVLGLGRDGAADLGRRHGQNAVVWSDSDALVRLLLLR